MQGAVLLAASCGWWGWGWEGCVCRDQNAAAAVCPSCNQGGPNKLEAVVQVAALL